MPELDKEPELFFADFGPIDELLKGDLAYMDEDELAAYRQQMSLTSSCAVQMKMSLKDVAAELSPMVQRSKARKTGKPLIKVDLDF